MPNANRVKAKVAIPIGLDNAYFAPLTSDTPGGTTVYGTPEYIARSIQATLTPVLKTGALDSDDAVEIDESEIIGYTVSIQQSQLDDYMKAKLFGHTVDDNGAVIVNKDDVPPRGALLFRSKLSDRRNFKYVALLNGSFKKPSEEYESDKRDSTTYKTETIEGNFYARESDGNIKFDLRSDSESASAEAIANWFTEVYSPEVSNGTSEETEPSGT